MSGIDDIEPVPEGESEFVVTARIPQIEPENLPEITSHLSNKEGQQPF